MISEKSPTKSDTSGKKLPIHNIWVRLYKQKTIGASGQTGQSPIYVILGINMYKFFFYRILSGFENWHPQKSQRVYLYMLYKI